MTQRPGEFIADSFVAASGNSLHLLRRQPPCDGGGGAGSGPLQFDEVLVTHGAQLTDVRWNRNNKVVAAGATDGTIQLLYSSGQVMCVLPRDGTPAAAYGPITSLSWSTGSKRLAAGSGNGNVYIHDMQSKVRGWSFRSVLGQGRAEQLGVAAATQACSQAGVAALLPFARQAGRQAGHGMGYCAAPAPNPGTTNGCPGCSCTALCGPAHS